MVPGLTLQDVNEILVLSRPNFVQKVFNGEFSPAERDVEGHT